MLKNEMKRAADRMRQLICDNKEDPMAVVSMAADSFRLVAYGDLFFLPPEDCAFLRQSKRIACPADWMGAWDLLGEDGSVYTRSANPSAKPVKYDMPAGFEAMAFDAAEAYGAHVLRAERAIVTCLPHVMFVVDRIETDVPVKLVSHFAVNDGPDGLHNHIAYWNKHVLRRGACGMKFFTFPVGEEMRMTQRCGICRTDGGDGAMLYDFTSMKSAKTHTVVHPFAISPIDEIKRWHIKNEDENTTFTVLSPKNAEQWQIRLTGEGITAEKLV